jgi:glutathione S-transferase
MITLYSGPLSLFSRKVEIALREKNLAFERIMVPFNQTTGYDPSIPKSSPSTRSARSRC